MKKIILLSLLFILYTPLLYCQTNEQKLSEVNKSLKAKQLEKQKLLKQENIYKRELKNLNSSIARTEKNLKKISKNISNAQNNLDKYSRQYVQASKNSSTLNTELIKELRNLKKMSVIMNYEQNPVDYKVVKEVLKHKKITFDKEKQTANISAQSMKKWQNEKANLLELKKKENTLIDEKKKLVEEKNNILKTTAGKRIAAEAQIKELNESSKALQSLVKKLSQKNKNNLTANKKIKTSLPWPVKGTIVLPYGKSKHPQLDTYVISNGIKIKATNNAQIKCVDDGTVMFTGVFRSYGQVVIVENKDFYTIYGQLDKILVSEEQKVSKNTVIGQVGSDDESVLYFEIRLDNNPSDPTLWLKAN